MSGSVTGVLLYRSILTVKTCYRSEFSPPDFVPVDAFNFQTELVRWKQDEKGPHSGVGVMSWRSLVMSCVIVSRLPVLQF